MYLPLEWRKNFPACLEDPEFVNSVHSLDRTAQLELINELADEAAGLAGISEEVRQEALKTTVDEARQGLEHVLSDLRILSPSSLKRSRGNIDIPAVFQPVLDEIHELRPDAPVGSDSAGGPGRKELAHCITSWEAVS